MTTCRSRLAERPAGAYPIVVFPAWSGYSTHPLLALATRPAAVREQIRNVLEGQAGPITND